MVKDELYAGNCPDDSGSLLLWRKYAVRTKGFEEGGTNHPHHQRIVGLVLCFSIIISSTGPIPPPEEALFRNSGVGGGGSWALLWGMCVYVCIRIVDCCTLRHR